MKKLILSSAAMVMAFSFSAIAGTPETKGEANAKVAVTPEVVTATAESMYWFPTNEAGNALVDPAGIPLNQEPSADAPCEAQTLKHCAKGFAPEDTHISGGKRVPTPPVSSGRSAYKN